MDLGFFNCLVNILTTSMFLISFMNCFPHKDSSNGGSVRFPEEPFVNHDYSILSEEFIDPITDKLVRSPLDNGWSAKALPQDSASHAVRRESNKVNGAPDGIVFPDQLLKLPKKNFTFVPVLNGEPACAQGKPFCEEADNYPRSHMKTILAKEELIYRTYFGKDIIPQDSFLANRIDDRNEKSLCRTKESVVFPKMAENKDGKWLFIANVDNYVQGVRIEECGQPTGSACDAVASFPNGYSASCQQKYIYRKLVALDDSGKTIPDSFRLPSCCACLVKFDFSARSLLNSTDVRSAVTTTPVEEERMATSSRPAATKKTRRNSE